MNENSCVLVKKIKISTLTGGIPREIGNLQSLVTFAAANSSLGGPIPESLFNISSLEEVYLQLNNFSGNHI